LEWLQKRPAIDFYVEMEGELGFVDLVRSLKEHDFSADALKINNKKVINTCYLKENKLISGPIERIKDINVIPSPILTGALDVFFDHPLVPMIETTRGCPFSCSFCADGLFLKNKVNRYDSQRTREELYYIAKKVKNINELIITDLNFGMYKQDLVTGKLIAEIQGIYDYPTIIDAPAGKNKPERVIETASLMNGWIMGASIQSTDPGVLKAIKRSNISSNAYQQIIDFGNSIETNETYTEIILGLPGDSKQTHLESLRFGVDSNVSSMRMYQAIMLSGTEMASNEDRKKYGLTTKFRTMAGCIGIYDIYGEKHPVAEIEEIIVSSNTLTSDDYADCRIINLIIRAFYNNGIFRETHAMLRSIGVSSFDCLMYIKEHPELYSERINEILTSFLEETIKDLFETWEEANQYVLSPKIINSYIGGDLGNNELALYSSLMFNEFDDMCNLMFESVKGILRQKGLLSQKIENYLLDLKLFTTMSKKDSLTDTKSVKSETFRYDFEEIQKVKFTIDPNTISVSTIPFQFDFFHNREQQKHISNAVKLYSNHTNSTGKIFNNSNMRLIFRNFSSHT
jgi:radical SAM superfamily enzyme YgiQ (UPF0313 family)